MANKDAAFGLKPIGKLGQNDDNQGLSEYSVAASSSAIYFQDPVIAAATGYITVGGAGDTLIGSLNSIFYTDATTSKPTWANNLAGSNTATDIVAFVADDPYERFEIQSDNSGASAQTDVFMNYDVLYAAGDSANYVSGVELDDSTTSTASGQLKVIGVSKDVENNTIGSANVNFVVTVNEHFYKAAVAGI
ncbi:MAG: hypothetical protein QF535_00850 [Anaerolineales bacterium]|jgi:hypothetical protein|nr:hypothetical protein [Anaerolineales bacterium]